MISKTQMRYFFKLDNIMGSKSWGLYFKRETVAFSKFLEIWLHSILIW